MSKDELPILTQEALLGEQGMDAVKALSPKLGFHFRDVTKGDFGIDAFVELFEPAADSGHYHMTGRLIALQIKCGKTIARSSGDVWRIYCSTANVNYWWRHSLPVILVYCDPATNSCYWVRIDDRSTRHARTDWVVIIPKTNKLEDAKDALTAIASGGSAVVPRTFPQMFVLPFDEENGLQVTDDEELGVMSAEIVAASSGTSKPEITVDLTSQLLVSAQLDELDAKQTLSINERRQRLMLDEIDSRYQRKKADIVSAIRIMLTHPCIGKAYFGLPGNSVQGQALRRLVNSYTINALRGRSGLSIDVFPSIAKTEPIIRIELDEHERQALNQKAGITDLDVQLVAWWGFTAVDLTRDVFVAKLLPMVAKTFLSLSQHRDQSVDEVIEDIGVPIECWVIGRS